MARIFVLCLCVFLIGCFADNSFERVKRAPGRNCPRFTNFNGKPVKYRRNGTRALFRCKKGFTRYGNKAVNCRSDNTWTGEPPVCIKANCVPKDIRHLDKLDMTELYGGALLTFSCEDNYKLIGITEIYCNGKVWNADPPVCKAPQQLLECDFENDLCGWSQDDSDDLDWIRNQGQTSTGGTGPRTDHTLQTTAGHYMFVESSNPAKNGDEARLVSPLYPTNMGNMCFEFWYHILGPDDQGHVGTLEVYVIGESEFVEDLQPVFVKDGNQGDVWRRGEIYIDQRDEPYQIVIAAVRKLSYISDIAIDDVRLYNCSGTTIPSSTQTIANSSTTNIQLSNNSVPTFSSISYTTFAQFTSLLPNITSPTASHLSSIVSSDTTPASKSSIVTSSLHTMHTNPSQNRSSVAVTTRGLSTTTVAQSTSTTISTTLPTTESTSIKSSSSQSTTPKRTPTAPSVSTIKSSSVSATTASTTLTISTSTASPSSSTASVSTTGGVPSTSGSSTEPSTSSVNTPTTIGTTTKSPNMPTTKSTMTTQVLTTTRPSTSKPTTSTTLSTPTSTAAATSTIPSTSTIIPSTKKRPTAAPTTEMSSTATTSKAVVTTIRQTTLISSTLSSSSSTTAVNSSSVNPDTSSFTKASTYTKRTKPTKITKSKATRKVKPTKPTRKVKPTKLTKPTRKVKPTKPVTKAKPTKRPSKEGLRTTSPTKVTTEQLISTSTVSIGKAETTESVVKTPTTTKSNDTEIKISIGEQRAQHPDDETLKPLMIGLGVGIFCGLIIIGVVAWVCVRRKKFYTRGYEDELKPITKSSSNDNFTGIQYEYHDDEYEQ